MFVVIFLVLLLGLGFIGFGGIMIGMARDSIFLNTISKYDNNNEQERKKIMKTFKTGGILIAIGLVLVGIVFITFR